MNSKDFKKTLIELSKTIIKKDVETNHKNRGSLEDPYFSGDILSMKKGEEIRYEAFVPDSENKYYDLDYPFVFNCTDSPFCNFNIKSFKKSKWYFLDPWALLIETKRNQMYERDIKDSDFDKKKVELIVNLFSD